MTHKFYHTTLNSNKKSILENGLIPAIGERSIQLGESIEKVYLFNSLDDLDSALSSWLGDSFNESDVLATFEVTLDITRPGLNFNLDTFETSSTTIIEKSTISYLRED